MGGEAAEIRCAVSTLRRFSKQRLYINLAHGSEQLRSVMADSKGDFRGERVILDSWNRQAEVHSPYINALLGTAFRSRYSQEIPQLSPHI